MELLQQLVIYNGLPVALPIFADSRGVGRCERLGLRFRLWWEHLLPTLLELWFLCTDLSPSLLLTHGTFFPHSLPLPIWSVLAYNSGFPAPVSSSSPSFLSAFSFFSPPFHSSLPPLTHNPCKHTLHAHDPRSLPLVPHLICLFPSPIILRLLHLFTRSGKM